MEIYTMRTKRTTDKVYNRLAREYRANITLKLEERFIRLIEYLNSYLLNPNNYTLSYITNLLKTILVNNQDLALDNTNIVHFTNQDILFGERGYYRLLEDFILMRRATFKKALILAEELVKHGEIIKIDVKVLEDFNLAKGLLENNLFDDLLADLRIYHTPETLERFDMECILMEQVTGYLNYGVVDERGIEKLREYNGENEICKFDKRHTKILVYLEKRFLPKIKKMDESDGN